MKNAGFSYLGHDEGYVCKFRIFKIYYWDLWSVLRGHQDLCGEGQERFLSGADTSDHSSGQSGLSKLTPRLAQHLDNFLLDTIYFLN